MKQKNHKGRTSLLPRRRHRCCRRRRHHATTVTTLAIAAATAAATPLPPSPPPPPLPPQRRRQQFPPAPPLRHRSCRHPGLPDHTGCQRRRHRPHNLRRRLAERHALLLIQLPDAAEPPAVPAPAAHQLPQPVEHRRCAGAHPHAVLGALRTLHHVLNRHVAAQVEIGTRV